MTKKNILIKHDTDLNDGTITLPASKSISNRALIINALAGGQSAIHNLSEARDTQTMRHLLNSPDHELDVLDAGTTMRFLTAYVTIKGREHILTGSARMQERPIKILADALTTLGGRITYLKANGFPPLHVEGFRDAMQKQLTMQGNVSSQYISAVLMIAPLLENGLIITLKGKVSSRPYIEMTQSVMSHFGVKSHFDGERITVPCQKYTPASYTVEPDWSAASYWFGLIALSNRSKVRIKGLKPESIQGDRRIVEIMKPLGVSTSFDEDGAVLAKSDAADKFDYNFTDCPDLAQTVAVVCAAKGIEAEFTGLESLKIKETDRVGALQAELKKIGAQLIEEESRWVLKPAKKLPERLFFNTYEDHRMAMAFAPLAMKSEVGIEDGEVVNKSYPRFWDDLRLAGLKVQEI